MQPQLLTVIDKEALKKWTADEWSNWQIEPKRDGFRLLIVDGVPQSRSGKPLHNIQHILDELGRKAKGFVLDGELHGSTWEETSHVARASKSERDTKLTYTIFDCLSIDEWKAQRCAWPLADRQAFLQSLLQETAHVKFVKPVWGIDYEDFASLHKHNLDDGCDGTVLKLRDSLYEFKRTKTWLKVKPVLDCDCLVVGMKEGTGKYAGLLGALEVVPDLHGDMARGENGFGEQVTTFVSGMSDEQRSEWWNYNTLMGKWIEVSYRKVNPSGRLVEPRFVRVRTDKN